MRYLIATAGLIAALVLSGWKPSDFEIPLIKMGNRLDLNDVTMRDFLLRIEALEADKRTREIGKPVPIGFSFEDRLKEHEDRCSSEIRSLESRIEYVERKIRDMEFRETQRLTSTYRR